MELQCPICLKKLDKNRPLYISIKKVFGCYDCSDKLWRKHFPNISYVPKRHYKIQDCVETFERDREEITAIKKNQKSVEEERNEAFRKVEEMKVRIATANKRMFNELQEKTNRLKKIRQDEEENEKNRLQILDKNKGKPRKLKLKVTKDQCNQCYKIMNEEDFYDCPVCIKKKEQTLCPCCILRYHRHETQEIEEIGSIDIQKEIVAQKEADVVTLDETITLDDTID